MGNQCYFMHQTTSSAIQCLRVTLRKTNYCKGHQVDGRIAKEGRYEGIKTPEKDGSDAYVKSLGV